MYILGVRIDNFSKKEILEKIEFFLNEGSFHQVATVNPEFILRAQKDESFKNILNRSGLNIADGIGLKYAFLKFGKWLKCRIAGADLVYDILKIANEKRLSVFLAVNKNGLSSYEEIKLSLSKKYPNLYINGVDIDPNYCSTFHVPRSTILFCNFGAPNQEYFINSVKNDTIRLAMGVGGSFDFACGKICRAPKVMRFFGLEWLYRLLFQSWSDKEFLFKRWKRIFNAVIIFPVKIIFSKRC